MHKHSAMGPLQMISHVVQKHLAGEQETHRDKTNKELTSSEIVIVFVCLVPVLSNHLQRAHLMVKTDLCETYNNVGKHFHY